MKNNRNLLCTCGSGKKYKKCCLPQIREKERVRNISRQKPDSFIMEINQEVEEECDKVLELLENDNTETAREMADRCLSEHPQNHMVQFLYGVLLIKEEKLSNAIPYFEKAIRIYPYFSEAYFNLGNIFFKKYKITKGLKCLKKVVEIEGEQAQLGKQAKKVIDDFAHTVNQSQGLSLDQYFTSEETFDQAFVNLQNKNFEEAILLFKKVLSIDSNHVQSYGNMGLAQAYLGNRNKALECLDKALSIDSDYGPAISNRPCIVTMKEGEPIKAITRDVRYYTEELAHNDIFLT